MFTKQMTCSPYCIIAAGFIFATIATSCLGSKNIQDFYSDLTEEQKVIKNQISFERLKIYLTGTILGCFVASLFYIWINKNSNAKICILLSIVLATSYFYYILSPKSKYMISYLNSKEQIEQWLKIYKQMQFNYHIGFLLGMSGIIALSASFC